MTWTLETKTQDVAPAKRGDEWKTLTTYHVKDDKGRHVTCISPPSSNDLLRPYQLDEQECAEAARLIAAAPALLAALQMLLMEGHGPISDATLIQCNDAIAQALYAQAEEAMA
jgi:hypothetical protein